MGVKIYELRQAVELLAQKASKPKWLLPFCVKSKLLPSARASWRVGAFLVHAARERRPEGPAYLLSSVMLLYLAGQCALDAHTSPLWTSGTRRVFPSSCGRILAAVPELRFRI